MKKKSPWSAKQVKKCINKGGMCLNKKIDKCNDGTFKSIYVLVIGDGNVAFHKRGRILTFVL